MAPPLLRIHLARFVIGCAMLSSVVIFIRRTKGEDAKITVAMDEGRKRVLAIIAGILVARHLKTTEDLFDNRGSPKTTRVLL